MISADLIEAIFRSADCTSTDATRYHLSKVHLKRTSAGWEVAATQGHMLVVHKFDFDHAQLLSDKYNFDAEWIEVAKAIVGSTGFSKDRKVIQTEGQEYLSFGDFNLRLDADTTSIYPDYNQVYPTSGVLHKFAINADYLSRVAKALGKRSNPIIELSIREGFSAIEINMEGAQSTAYLMPCRLSKP